MKDKVVLLNDDNFENIISENELVLVDVYTSWCGPCKAMSPIIDELSSYFENKAIISKIDADSNTDTAIKLNVRSVPTIILFKGGVEVERQVGAKSKNELIKLIEKFQSDILTN